MSRAKTWAAPHRQIHQAIAAAGNPPKGVRVEVRGQITPMEEMFSSMAIGLAIAVRHDLDYAHRLF